MGESVNNLVLLGAPGSGKGTQAALLASRLAVPAISTGDMIRAAIASDSELGRRVEVIVSAGDLVDDTTMGAIVESRLGEADTEGGFLLDGYPRTLPQADMLEGILQRSERQLTAVLMVEVPEAELVSRMLGRGREDDQEDVIRRRLAVYKELTQPLVDHYRERGKLIEIDGYRSIEEVNQSLLQALGVERRPVGEAQS